jgi:mono/diheme cytochrome c family protein
MKRQYWLIVLMILMVVLLAACSSAPPEPTETPVPTAHPGKSLVSSRCLGCHSINQLENSAFNERGWQLVVERMRMLGVQLNDDQVAVVVDYLAQAYPYDEE